MQLPVHPKMAPRPSTTTEGNRRRINLFRITNYESKSNVLKAHKFIDKLSFDSFACYSRHTEKTTIPLEIDDMKNKLFSCHSGRLPARYVFVFVVYFISFVCFGFPL